jgi:hypothetical protein
MARKRSMNRSKILTPILALTACALLLMSCGGLPLPGAKATATPQPAIAVPQIGLETPTMEAPSATPEVLMNTAAIPTETASPTPVVLMDTATPYPTLSPTAIPTVAGSIPAGDIVFEPGITAKAIQGTIDAGQVLTYTVGAAKFQPMTLILGSTEQDVTIGLSEANGNVLLDPGAKRSAFQMILPATQLYTITVVGGAATENYSLTVKLPQVVTFASGTTSTTISGTTLNGYLYSYALNCGAGQTMTVSLNVPASTAVLDIYGMSTGTILNASTGVNTWTGTLPQYQNYVIEVVPVGGKTVDYSMTVSVTGGNPNAAITGGEIVFVTNTTAAVMTGTVQPGQVIDYTIRASRTQVLRILVESPNRDVTLGLYEENGDTLVSPSKKWNSTAWKLPKTETYTIRVIGGKTAESFTLTVKVAPVIYFQIGKDTVTLYGTTHLGYVQSYAFQCSEDQIMTVSLDVPATKAYIDIYGVETGLLVDKNDMLTSWTGRLPKTQTYVIEVVPRHGYLVSYGLTVTIP